MCLLGRVCGGGSPIVPPQQKVPVDVARFLPVVFVVVVQSSVVAIDLALPLLGRIGLLLKIVPGSVWRDC